jgi:hypothetical protein
MVKDHCMICKVETAYDKDTHIDMRIGYIEGFGQLCPKCYEAGIYRNHILVPEWLVENYPNNQELGSKVRTLYFESKK